MFPNIFMTPKDEGPGRTIAARIADLLGVVLCGGESRRMGRDKGLLITDGIPWALRMGEKLKPWNIPVVYSINKGQIEVYSAHLSAGTLVVDRIGLAGPMEGLLTVHAEYPDRDLLLLACDLQDLDEHTLSALIKSYLADEERRASAYAYADGAGMQPLCAIYTKVLLRSQYQRVAKGEPVDLRLRSLLTSKGVRVLATVSERVFKNYNTL